MPPDMLALLGGTCLSLLILVAIGMDAGHAADVWPDPARHAWFESQHSANGQWCCDLADGHLLDDADWKTEDGAYWVRIDGTWTRLPDFVLRDPKGGPNITGHAIAWYGPLSGRDVVPIMVHGLHQYLYCFAPGWQG